VCLCASHFFYTLITPECDTPQSRVDGCTLNENRKFYSFMTSFTNLAAYLKKFNFQLTISG